MPLSELSSVRDRRRLRWFLWRGLALALVFGAGLTGFLLGVDVSDRPGVADAGLGVQLYYTVGLFVLGGLDLGVPVGGPLVGRVLLWIAYFGAPAITASAVVEGVLRAIDPQRWRLRGLRDHIVIGGCGRLAMLYLQRLREVSGARPTVVIVEAKSDHPYVPAAETLFRARVITGNISGAGIIAGLRLDRARRVMLLTGDDFVNLDAAAQMLSTAPDLAGRMVVHVADLRFKRLMKATSVARHAEVFNIYQSAAVHLVDTEIIPYFEQTEFRDIVVLAGFGRLGQTILDQLQRRALDSMAAVIIIDTDADERAMVFDDQCGFADGYERHIVEGDANDLGVWNRVEALYDFATSAPAFLLVSGNDALNLRVAMRLGDRYPAARVLARSYFRSTFAEEVSRDAGFRTFSVAEQIVESMPDSWFS
jgi:voltage-gated potassium channel Kch